jgi:hypothetical protein
LISVFNDPKIIVGAAGPSLGDTRELIDTSAEIVSGERVCPLLSNVAEFPLICLLSVTQDDDARRRGEDSTKAIQAERRRKSQSRIMSLPFRRRVPASAALMIFAVCLLCGRAILARRDLRVYRLNPGPAEASLSPPIGTKLD